MVVRPSQNEEDYFVKLDLERRQKYRAEMEQKNNIIDQDQDQSDFKQQDEVVKGESNDENKVNVRKGRKLLNIFRLLKKKSTP